MRIVCVSDTHEQEPELPLGDILIHAGDLTLDGSLRSTGLALKWLRQQPHKHKIFVGGNHDLALSQLPALFNMEGLIYLNDDWTEVNGLLIGGSPVSRFYQEPFSAFTKKGDELTEHWNRIDSAFDILITHGPPYGIRDKEFAGGHQLGDVPLFTAVMRMKPKFHIFGHIHGGYGVTDMNGTRFINAAHLDAAYKPTNPPIVIDL